MGALFGWLLFMAAAAGDDAQKLDAFLERLGLAELRALHLEMQLNRETDAKRRAELAKALGERYVEALLAAADDAERFAALRAKVEAYLTTNPAARTAELEIVLLQAEYQQAEAIVLAWQEDPAAGGLAEARQILGRIQPRLAEHQQTLAAAAEKTAEIIDGQASEGERRAAEQQLEKQRLLGARADYFAGWSAYYLGVLREERAAAKTDFEDAKRHFLRLLEVSDEEDYKHVEAEGLGLESVWRARAVIGLGLAELGLGNVPAGERVLSWLNQAAVTPTIREQEAYWRLRGLLSGELWAQAAEMAAGEVALLVPAPSAGKSSFCVAAIRAGARMAKGPEQRTLIVAGVTGLARMRQFEALDKLVEQLGLDQGEVADDFQLVWLRGRREYLAAEKKRDAEGFEAAARSLTSALRMPAARDHPAEAAQARYYLGWAKYRLGKFDEAADLFAEAAATLRASYADVAAQALWMRATTLVEWAQKEPRRAMAAVAALQAFKQEFPSAPEAERVDIVVARLRQTQAAGEEALKDLARVKPGDPTYAAAQFEICRIRHELWRKAKKDAGKLADLLASVERVLRPGEGIAADLRVKAALLGVDGLRQAEPADSSRIGELLARVAEDARRMPEGAAARVEYAYRRLEVAKERGNNAEAAGQAAWIAEHGAGTPYELPALILVARAADSAVAGAAGAAREEKLTEARRVYARLVTLLGETPAAFESSKNAIAAAAKLAQIDEELEHWPEAAARLSRLVAAQPADRRLLRRAALANYQAGQFSEALRYFRTLLAGLESGTEEWLEAKYFQIVCLQKTDPEAAEKTLKQFRLLFPEVKSAAWEAKFRTLAGMP